MAYRAIPVLRPFNSLFVLFITIIGSFFVRHSPFKEGLLAFFINALLEITGAVWHFLLAEKEKGIAHVQKYADDDKNQLPK